MMNPSRKSLSRIPLWLGLLLSALAMACQSLAPGNVQPTPPPATPAPTVITLPPLPSQIVGEEAILVNLYERVNPSVVNITIYGRVSGVMEAFGQGSGFVYDGQGHIVTNAHVVHGAEQIDVTFYDGLTRPASLVGEDLHSDLAVIQVDLPAGIGPLPLGEMSELAVGQTVVAIGNPFGLSGTLTRGVISALGRTIPGLTIFSIPQAIQTDAAINPGNSGGPLLNLQGEVIGVNAQIETGGQGRSNVGVGFAIPVSIVQRVVPSLIEKGAYEWPWLGVVGNDLTPPLVEAMNLPVERGAYLVQIVENGPADRAGLRGASRTVNVDGRQIRVGGDVVTAINGQPVNTFDDLLIYIALQTSPGQEVTLSVLRDGKTQDIVVKLQPRPNN